MTRQLTRVEDIDRGVVISRAYDVAIFASGYESRARAIARRLRFQSIGQIITLGFPDQLTLHQRVENDAFFADRFETEPILVDGNSACPVSGILSERFAAPQEHLRIFVDISSMSRVWYADILNWAKYASAANRIEIDFAYASGEYVGSYPTRAVSQTIALLGFEGRADPNVESVALFGLGYDPITPPSVLEDLQPDWKYAFVAGEGDDGGVARTLKLNKAILDELDGPPVILPLMSIQQSYRTVGEMVAPHVGLRNCIIVPLGPKSHVLASLLVASRSEAVSCLYVKGGLNEPIDVREGRSMTFCSVLFE